MSESEEARQEQPAVTENEAERNPLAEDEELTQYGENVRARIAAETKKRAEVERRLQETSHRLGEASRAADAAMRENQSLRAGRVDADRAIIDNLLDKSTGDLELAKQRYREAHEEGDATKIADALANVSMAASDLRRVQLAKAGYRPPQDSVQPEPNPQQPQQQPQQPQQQVAPRARAWVERNPWYGQDPERHRLARAADVYVAAMGFDPNSDQYYEEVDKMLASRVQQQNGAGPTRPVAGVTPSGRSSVQPANPTNRVALSPNEVSQAKRLGVSPEAYAAAKRAGGVVLE